MEGGLYLDSVAVTSLSTLRATFSVAVDPDTVDDPSEWSLKVLTSLGAQVTVASVQVAPSNLVVILGVHPQLTPGAQYLLTALDAATVAPALAAPNAIAFVVSAGLTPAFEDVPDGVLKTFLHAFGLQCQKIYGVPVTRLVDDLQEGEGTALVESTLTFPTKGRVWIEGVHVEYGGKADGALLNVVPDRYLRVALSRGSEVFLDVTSVPPDELKLFPHHVTGLLPDAS